MKKLFLLFVVGFYFTGYSQSNKYIIDLDKVKEKELIMSDFFKSVEYIPLELTDSCLLPNDAITPYITEKYIVVTVLLGRAFLFDRKTGTFLREISRKGGGPDDYSSYSLYYDERDNRLLVNNNKSWKSIDIETNKNVTTIIKPSSKYAKERIHQGEINNPYKLDDNTYAGYTNNVTGNYPHILAIFNKSGEVIKTYPNYIFYKKEGREIPLHWGHFYEFEGDTYFKANNANDTVYKLTDEKLIPHIIFKIKDKGEKGVIDHSKGIPIPIKEDNSLRIGSIFETGKYVFFYCYRSRDNSGFYYYDKNTGNTYKYRDSDKEKGFINDFDGLGSFIPKVKTKTNKFVGCLNPEILLEGSASNKGKPVSKKAKALLMNMREDDNPIIVIATLK